MRVTYLGNFQPDHSTENHYARAFEANGCEVTRVQESDPDALDQIEDASHTDSAPDLFLWTRTWPIDMADGWRLLRRLEARGTLTAAVHLDTWANLDREYEVVCHPMFRVGRFFTVDGDAAALWNRAGVSWCWLPPGVVEDEAYDAEPFDRAEVPWDVAFVGSRGYHEEWPHRPELVDRLREWYGDRFVHVGGDGDLPTMRGVDQLNRFYATVPICIGDSLGARPDGRYWSDRFTETWGRGGFLIFPYIRALASAVGVGYPAWTVGDWDELHREIEAWLADPYTRGITRERIAKSVRAHHTYTQRAMTILSELGLR